MKQYLYQTYGLSIASEIRIEAFQEVNEFEAEASIIEFKQSPINFEGITFIDDFVIREYTKDGFLYVIKNTVAFLIQGNTVLIQPLITNDKVWQAYLIGGAMSIILMQRGYFLLHGSAVEINGEAYLFVGESGVGKSSIAAGLEQKGCKIITDDICVISKKGESLYINAGTKQLRLMKDAVEKLNIETVTSLEHPKTQPKYGYSFYKKSGELKTKIKGIIELLVDENMEEEIVVKKAQSFERIELLKSNVYKDDLAKTLNAHAHNFQFMMISANNIDCYKLKRRNSNYNLHALLDLVQRSILDNN